MRKPEPWYREERKGWYVQVNKAQVRLGADKNPKRDREGKPVAPPVVMREYHRIMSSSGLTSDSDREKATVGEVVEAFLAVKSRLSPKGYAHLVWFMRKFAEPYLNRRFRTIRVADIERIAADRTTWNDSSKHAFAAKVQGLFRWAKDAGYLEFNPLAGWEVPWVEAIRERSLTDAEFLAIADMASDLEFKQILGFMRATACRPSEARKLTAAHIHPEKPIATLAPHEHKTGKKTKKSKIILMTKDVEQMVRALVVQYPTGPIFRNSRAGKKGGKWGNGIGWGEDTLAARFRKYRDKLGLGKEVVPYVVRHTSLSNMLNGGMSLHHVMVVGGHTQPSTLMRTYYHADQEIILEAIEKSIKPKAKKLKGPAA